MGCRMWWCWKKCVIMAPHCIYIMTRLCPVWICVDILATYQISQMAFGSIRLVYHLSGPVFCLLLGVSSDYAQPITGQATEVICPVIGWAQPELTPSKRQKTGPDLINTKSFWKKSYTHTYHMQTLLVVVISYRDCKCGWPFRTASRIGRSPHLVAVTWKYKKPI